MQRFAHHELCQAHKRYCVLDELHNGQKGALIERVHTMPVSVLSHFLKIELKAYNG